MAQRKPEEYDFLAVVSEWSSTTAKGGVVGNAYPLLNVTTNEVVTAPQDEFANPGAVFLTSRGNLNAWDFVILRPRPNDRYMHQNERDCYYISDKPPEPLTNPKQASTIAVVLSHPTFELSLGTTQIANPRHNVTPIFYVQKDQVFIGPFVREAAPLTLMDDVQRIDWRPAQEDWVVYEFTAAELKHNGIQLVKYSHPEPSLNRVINSAIQFALGNVVTATSGSPRDTLSGPQLLDWYLQRCPTEVPTQMLASLRGAFRAGPGDEPAVQAARLQKVEREMTTHAEFQSLRERAAKRYVESDPGQQRIQELIEQTIEKRATEIQSEVDKLNGELAAKRQELTEQLAAAECKALLLSLLNRSGVGYTVTADSRPLS